MTATVTAPRRSSAKKAPAKKAPAKKAPAKKALAKKAAPRSVASRSLAARTPGLFLIDFAALRSRTRRRRLAIGSLVLLVLAFFGVALVQAQLVQTQSELDRLEVEIDRLENDIALLDRDVVVASSPEEVVRRARALGMVRSVRPVYLVATRPVGK